jgi:hypothetical protein
MFENFQSAFQRDEAASEEGAHAGQTDYPKLTEFLRAFGGASFARGLYRIASFGTLSRWDERITIAYPDYEGRVTCFGYDWLGRAFALDWSRMEGDEPGILMFEIGTGYALQISCNLQTFHEDELPEFAEEALALSFYREWLAQGGPVPSLDQCVGYKIPLFLGGDDGPENLELADLDVYWHLTGQLAAAARYKPPGTVLDVSG